MDLHGREGRKPLRQLYQFLPYEHALTRQSQVAVSFTRGKIGPVANVTNTARAKALLEGQLSAVARLRGTGPNPFDYDMWESRTREVVEATFGEDSDEMRRYEEEIGKRGRLPGVRGPGENMTLNIHGPWGILARLDRAEALLGQYITSLN